MLKLLPLRRLLVQRNHLQSTPFRTSLMRARVRAWFRVCMPVAQYQYSSSRFMAVIYEPCQQVV
jgi:hypothetical protein